MVGELGLCPGHPAKNPGAVLCRLTNSPITRDQDCQLAVGAPQALASGGGIRGMDNGDAKTNNDTRQDHPSGFVYILSNQAFEGLLKIGETSLSPYQRARELQGTGVPRPFIVERAFFVKDRKTSESLLHKALEIHRLEDNREFFRTSVFNAVSVAGAILRLEKQIDTIVHPKTNREMELDEEVLFLRERLKVTETALEATRRAYGHPMYKSASEKEDDRIRSERFEKHQEKLKRGEKLAREAQKAAVEREAQRAERAESIVRKRVGEGAYKDLEDIKKVKYREFKAKYP